MKESGQLRPLTLAENRRSQKPILDWVNAVFSQLMVGEAGLQAEYIALQPNAELQRDDLAASVQVFGEPMDLKADALRREQARHVASLIADSAGAGASQPCGWSTTASLIADWLPRCPSDRPISETFVS